jgi:hypothetical protein
VLSSLTASVKAAELLTQHDEPESENARAVEYYAAAFRPAIPREGIIYPIAHGENGGSSLRLIPISLPSTVPNSLSALFTAPS